MNIRPVRNSVTATEGGTQRAKRSDESDDNGRNGGTGLSGSRDTQMMICIELVTGNLQRNITVIAMTIGAPTATGI